MYKKPRKKVIGAVTLITLVENKELENVAKSFKFYLYTTFMLSQKITKSIKKYTLSIKKYTLSIKKYTFSVK